MPIVDRIEGAAEEADGFCMSRQVGGRAALRKPRPSRLARSGRAPAAGVRSPPPARPPAAPARPRDRPGLSALGHAIGASARAPAARRQPLRRAARRAPACRARSSRSSAHSTSTGSAPSARRPPRMRSARAASRAAHRLAELKHIEARAVGAAGRDFGQLHAWRRAAAASRACRSPGARPADCPRCARPAVASASALALSPARAKRARSHCGRRARSTGQIGSQAPRCLHRLHPRERLVSRSSRAGDDQQQQILARGFDQPQQRRRAGDAGLAARQPHLDDAARGKQRQRLRRLLDLAPTPRRRAR